jgi:hypothetical protein
MSVQDAGPISPTCRRRDTDMTKNGAAFLGGVSARHRSRRQPGWPRAPWRDASATLDFAHPYATNHTAEGDQNRLNGPALNTHAPPPSTRCIPMTPTLFSPDVRRQDRATARDALFTAWRVGQQIADGRGRKRTLCEARSPPSRELHRRSKTHDHDMQLVPT